MGGKYYRVKNIYICRQAESQPVCNENSGSSSGAGGFPSFFLDIFPSSCISLKQLNH